MSKQKALLLGGAVLVALIGLAVFSPFRQPETRVAGVVYPSPKEEQNIKIFMEEPNLGLRYQQSRSSSNFAVAEMKELPGGGGSVGTVPDVWKRTVDVYHQVGLTKDCQYYEYEVDQRSFQVVQVQLANRPGVGTEAENDQAQCMKSLPKQTLTVAQAKEIALAYAIKYKGNLDGFTLKAEPKDGADRYDFTWEQRDYKLPNGLSSDPWPYPTIRVVIHRAGYLMTYLNTAVLYDPQ